MMMLPLTVVHETSGLLFVNKAPGLAFHARAEHDDPGLLTLLRELRPGERLHSVHRLDRVTSGLLMVAKSADAARDVGALLRGRDVHKYYVALSARKPSKKMGRVMGDMERSRRGSWKLLRSMERPAVTSFVSRSVGDEGDRPLRGFLLKPQTGRTHQLRVALKALSSPILGDPLYAAADAAALEERTFLHAAALRLPAGHAALSDDTATPIEVTCAPEEGATPAARAFFDAYTDWFSDVRPGAPWFEGTVVASRWH
jgi:tRNA pseudouridine32 synthase/23S rRNA pseudouridine746 synthase